MTPRSHADFVTRNEAESLELGNAEPAPATPRDFFDARVPGINHPQALSSQFQSPQIPEVQKQQKIERLLHHYRDVCDGLRDARGSDPCADGCSLDPKDQHLCRMFGCANPGVLALMSEAWNHPSYQRLERLLYVLAERFPKHRAAIRDRYERFSERRIAYCPVCKKVEQANKAGDSHVASVVAGKKLHCRERGIIVNMQIRVDRVPPASDNPKRVEEALEWLTRHWKGPVELPAAVAEIEAERELRRVA